jgi:hypothetical protein
MPAEDGEDFMTTKADRNSQSIGNNAPFRGAASAEQMGAPPSNTAPDKCNPEYFQPLRWGVDSLYLSYPGQLSESAEAKLKELKMLAQCRDDMAALAQYPIQEHCFEVKDKGSGLFPFILDDDAFRIQIASQKAKSLPMAYVKLSSRYLSHKTPTEAEHHLRILLQELGEVEVPKASRIDLFVDFASSFDMESVGRHAWVIRAKDLSQYAQNGAFTGWLIGAGGVMMARLYNKQIEIQKTGKTYLEPLWREAGWKGELPVWRLEFQFKREVLDQLGLSGLPSVMGNLNGLWSYATTEWLNSLCPANRIKLAPGGRFIRYGLICPLSTGRPWAGRYCASIRLLACRTSWALVGGL